MVEFLAWMALIGVIVGPLALVRLIDRRTSRPQAPGDRTVDVRRRHGSMLSYYLGGHEDAHFMDIYGGKRRR